MKKHFKGFFIGAIITSVLMTNSFTMAQSMKKMIEVVFNGVNLKVNGQVVKADNILYNGTTYVPLRAIGEMLGKDIGWDQDTNTASINDKVFKDELDTVVEEVENSRQNPAQIDETWTLHRSNWFYWSWFCSRNCNEHH